MQYCIKRTILIRNLSENNFPVSSGSDIIRLCKRALVDCDGHTIKGVYIDDRFTYADICKGMSVHNTVLVNKHRIVINSNFDPVAELCTDFFKFLAGNVCPKASEAYVKNIDTSGNAFSVNDYLSAGKFEYFLDRKFRADFLKAYFSGSKFCAGVGINISSVESIAVFCVLSAVAAFIDFSY